MHLALAALLAACAPQGSFPSLLPRAVEQQQPAAEPVAVEPDSPADPALAARLDDLLARARQGQQAFEAELGTATAAVRRSGAAHSESWIEAQQALSRLEAARAPTMSALTELDALAVEQSRANGVRRADRAAVAAALDQLNSLANGQRDDISRLSALLPPA
jgi:hypothetical protein